MKLLSYTSFLFVLGIEGIPFEPPAVAAIVSTVKQKYSPYINYNGTAAEAPVILANDTEATILPRQSPYWYEEIAHQGISAFGPSGYVVYRNVKDYGATGTSEM
jgi:glucan 1,3-beta-glucosidase